MEGIVGVFRSRASADQAVDGLRSVGFSPQQITYVTPETTDEELAEVPSMDAEERGIGKAISGYLGGLVGASGGLALGAVAAGALVPGVGPVIVAGMGGAALLGAGGVAAGAALGENIERNLDTGVPRDDLSLYSELLNQGRSIVIAFADTQEMKEAASLVLSNNGGEQLHEARQELEELKQQESEEDRSNAA
ncbi:MAG: hypothetical protein AB7O65_07320 [Candidatus Korobacteraceae bacterium]